MISEVVKNTLRAEHPKATDADLEQIANAQEASNRRQALTGVPSAGDVKFDDAVAERGKTIILNSVKQAAELTREVFLFIRSCEDEDYVEGTFKVAETRAIKVIRDGQPEGEKPIKNLSDIAKIQGGPGAASYIACKAKLVKYMKDADELVNKLQEWYNFQAKHDGEPQMFVQPELLNPWSKRYSDEKRGWAQFTKDARLAEQCSMLLDQRKKALERAKGKEAAAQTGQNGSQTQQGVESGTRQRGNLADSTQKCLNAVIRAVQDVSEELPQEIVNGILSSCATALQDALAAKRAKTRAAVAETSSRPSQGIADAVSGGDAQESASDASVPEVLPESGAQAGDAGGGLVRPDWLRQEDWDAANDEERVIMMEDREAYEEELSIMVKGTETKDAESNEPIAAEPAEAKKG